MHRLLRLKIPIALLVTLGCVAIAPDSPARATAHAGAALSEPRSQPPIACTIAQVQFTYFGGDGAAGTAVTEIAASDLSRQPCVLSGHPVVQFYGGNVLNWRQMPVHINHEGPGLAFSANPKPVTLDAASTPTRGPAQAFFVFTTADFAADGSGTCPQLTSIEVGFAPAHHLDRVPLWYPTNICGANETVSVSSFFGGSPETYVNPAIAPLCAASEVATTTASDGVAMGHLGLILRFRNFGFVPCRISGYPSVVLIGRDGSHIKSATTKPSGYLGGLTPGTAPPPSVTLQPGRYASALLEDDNGNSANPGACATVSSLLVTAPFTTQPVRLAVRFDGCGVVEIHPVLPGPNGGARN